MTRLHLHPMLRLLGPIGLTLLITLLVFVIFRQTQDNTLQPTESASEESQLDESRGAEATPEEDEGSQTTSQVEDSSLSQVEDFSLSQVEDSSLSQVEDSSLSQVEDSSFEEQAIKRPDFMPPSEETVVERVPDGSPVELEITTTYPDSDDIAYNGELVTYTVKITPPADWSDDLDLWVNLSPGGKIYFQKPADGFCIDPPPFCFHEKAEEQSFPNPLGGTVTVTVTRQLTLTIPSSVLTQTLDVSFKALLVGQSNNTEFSTQVFYSSGDSSGESNEKGADVRIPIDDSGKPTLSSAPTWFSEDFGGTLSQDWADFDLDGDLDLALGSSAGAVIYEFNADENRLEKIWDNYNLSDNQRVAYGVRWGNFGGDEKLELVTVGASDDGTVNSNSTNRIYQFTGASPPFTNLDTFTSNTQFVRVETGDLDGDQLVDLVVGTNLINANCPVRFYRNTASEDDIFNQSFVCLSDQASANLSQVDINNDNERDLMLGLFESQSVGFLFGPVITDSTTSTITDRQAMVLDDTILFLPYDFAWGDYDSDGYLDLAAAYPLQREVRVYRNSGGNGFDDDPIEISTSLFRTPLALDWGDFDGDGKLDLVVNDMPPKIYNFKKTNSGRYEVESSLAITTGAITRNHQLWAIEGIDQDGDGDLDLAITNRDGPSSIFTLFAPRLATEITAVGSNRSENSVVWGDANRDQWLDVAFGASPGDILTRLYMNQGGDFSAVPLEFDAGVGPHSLAFGNMSGKKANSDNTAQEQSFELEDYALELAIGTSGGSKIYYSDNSDDTIWQAEESNSPTALAWGDVNDDRVLDLLVGNATGPLEIYLNDKDGELSKSPSWESEETDKVLNVAWGDYNNDHYLDFAVANEGGRARLYRNNGVRNVSEGQTFVQELSFTLVWNSPESNSTDVAWADIDQDGDLDLAVAYDGHENAIYKNQPASDGSQALDSDPFWQAPSAYSTTSLAWADFDNDGDLDLAVGNDEEADQLYVNEGDTFEWLWQSKEHYATTDLAWGDSDRDGDLDLAVSTGKNNEPNGFYLNNYILPSHLSDEYLATMPLPNNPSYVSIGRPKRNSASDSTDEAYLYSAPEILSGPQETAVAIPYKLYDPDGSRSETDSNAPGDKIVKTFFEYSLDGANWMPATPANADEPLSETSRLGQEGVFLWNAEADGAVSDHARFRVRIVPANHGKGQQASTSAISPPFRVRGQSCVWLRGAQIAATKKVPGTWSEKYNLIGSVIEGSGVATYNWTFNNIITNKVYTATGVSIDRVFSSGFYDIELEVVGEAESCLDKRPAKAVITEFKVGTGMMYTFSPLIISGTFTTTTRFIESTVASLPVTNDLASPSQVSKVQGKTKGDTTTLRWQPSHNSEAQAIRGYRIYRAPLGTSAFELLAEVDADETKYVDQAECGYLYYVTAFNRTGESPASKTSYTLLACQ